MIIDLLDDAVTVTDEQEQFFVNRIKIPGIHFHYQNNAQ
jgi:hypothetical protein